MEQASPRQLDALHWHAALDRSCICMEMVDTYLPFHPAIESDETLKKKVEEAHRLLFDVYQQIGARVADEIVE